MLDSTQPDESVVGALRQPMDVEPGSSSISAEVGKRPAIEMGQNSRRSHRSFWDQIKRRRCHKTLPPALATRNTLSRFDVLCTELKNDGVGRVDQQAAKLIRSDPRFITPADVIGSVPGVEVGDEFRFRTAMSIIGLHKQQHAEVDFTRHDNNDIICTSLLSSDCGGYRKKTDGREFLTFTSNAGASGKKQPVDQKLEGGILAMSNSQHIRNPVRVIRGNRKVGEGGKVDLLYIYDGLYEVDSFEEERAPTGKKMYTHLS